MTDPAEEGPIPSFEDLRETIAQNRQGDPLIGPKIGSQLALEGLLRELGSERGVHAETLMACTGILMGQSIQASLWAEAREQGMARVPGLQEVQCQDGSIKFVGDPLNRGLMEGYGSPWEMLSEAARQEGCEALPDQESLLLEGIRRLCTPAFGLPQVPPTHAPQVLSLQERGELWHWIQPMCQACCSEPGEWPLLCSLLAVRALRLVQPHVPPEVAWRLAMDAAIDATKVPLGD